MSVERRTNTETEATGGIPNSATEVIVNIGSPKDATASARVTIVAGSGLNRRLCSLKDLAVWWRAKRLGNYSYSQNRNSSSRSP